MHRNANPIPTPASASQPAALRERSESIARVVKYAATTMPNTMGASGLECRNITETTGMRAKRAAASRPALGPACRRTVARISAALTIARMACGISMLALEKPKILADNPINHKPPAGLSTVT